MLKPTHPRDIVKKTAEKLGIPEQDVYDIIYHFYATLKRKVRKPTKIRYSISGLGSIWANGLKLEKYLHKYERFQKQFEGKPDKVSKNLALNYSKDVTRFEKLCAMFKEHSARKWKKRIELYKQYREYYESLKNKEDLEKQRENPGRTNEQSQQEGIH